MGSAVSSASATVTPRDEPDASDKMFSGRIVGATAIAAVLLVVVLFVTGVIGGSGDSKTKGNLTTATPAVSTTATEATTTPSGTPVPAPADTTVAVLNGTNVTGLAQGQADKLKRQGYAIGATTNAADQAQQFSAVAYTDGFKESARKIAQTLGIPSSKVVPIDESTRAVAGNAASVVVTIGLDKATQ